MILRIQLVKIQHIAIISAYAPNLDAEIEIKKDFYSKFDIIILSTPKEDKIIFS